MQSHDDLAAAEDETSTYCIKALNLECFAFLFCLLGSEFSHRMPYRQREEEARSNY